MERRRFYFLEPSKVGSQHITLIEGYLTALISSVSIVRNFELNLCASKATLFALPDNLISKFRCRTVPVMNPEKRRLILKSFLELFVVLRYTIKLQPGDILFISCLLPTTLWLLEITNKLLRKSGLYVVLHGEVEGVIEKSHQPILRIGFWAAKWMNSRNAGSRISLVVLDDFICDRLIHEHADKLSYSNVSVIHHPVSPISLSTTEEQQNFTACFIGYRTRFKGFNDFSQMASSHPSISFLAIGGGKVENITTGMVKSLSDKNAYLREISKCSVALFPYTSGYICSLSAAALDALSTGVPIVAMDRPFFQSLNSYFGTDTVTVCSSMDEFSAVLKNRTKSLKQVDRASRLERLSNSKYGLASTQRAFEKLAFNTFS